jgi:hypothetical protein
VAGKVKNFFPAIQTLPMMTVGNWLAVVNVLPVIVTIGIEGICSSYKLSIYPKPTPVSCILPPNPF